MAPQPSPVWTNTVVSSHKHKSSWRAFVGSSVFQDLVGLIVITGSLLIYGVLQERIMTVGFGPHLELFENSIFLVLCNRLVTCLIAFVYIAFTNADVQPAAPLRSYASVSCTNVIATFCQYEALKYVSFAIQTLAKSAKALPVMVWGTVFTGRRYKAWEYLHASTISLGCFVFIMGGNAAARTVEQAEAFQYLAGAALMVLYLAVDGLTSTWQDSLFQGYNMTIADQVMYTTLFSTFLSFTGTIVTGQLVPSITFVLRNPDALACILALSASSATVQLIISYTIKRYGAVVFATIMTTRQFFSILLSSLVFLTPLKPMQWVGLVIVFGAMYTRLFRNGLGGGRGGKAGKADKSSSGAQGPVNPLITPLLAATAVVPGQAADKAADKV